MDKFTCIIIYNYLGVNDLLKMKDIEHVNHPLVWTKCIGIADMADFKKIKGLPITQLEIYCDIFKRKKSLSYICKMNLTYLNLSEIHITDAHVRQICNIQTLQTLYLCNNELYNECLKDIHKLTNLKDLSICGTQINKYAGKRIKKLNLDHLDVSYTSITNSFVKYISKMELKTLNLNRTCVTMKCAKYLCKMNLQQLEIQDTPIDARELKKLIPNTKIQYCETKRGATQFLTI